MTQTWNFKGCSSFKWNTVVVDIYLMQHDDGYRGWIWGGFKCGCVYTTQSALAPLPPPQLIKSLPPSIVPLPDRDEQNPAWVSPAHLLKGWGKLALLIVSLNWKMHHRYWWKCWWAKLGCDEFQQPCLKMLYDLSLVSPSSSLIRAIRIHTIFV